MVAPAMMFELWKHCPQLACGENIESNAASHVCPHCHAAFKVCPTCRATNRLLTEFCRGCGRALDAATWPMHPGLKATAAKRVSIEMLGQPLLKNFDAAVVASPLASDGIIFLPQLNGQITLIDERDGKQMSVFSVAGRIQVTPALCAGILFIASDSQLFAFDMLDYLDQPLKDEMRPLWSREAQGEAISQPILADARAVYFITRRGKEAFLNALSTADGTPLWPEAIRLHTHMTHPAVLLKEHLVVVTLDGQIYIVGRETGRLETLSVSYLLDPQVYPFAYENRVLLADPHGLIFEIAIDYRGTFINQLYDHRVPVTSIVAGSDLIILSHTAGLTLLTVNGNLRWSFDSIDSFSVAPIIAGRSIFALNDVGNGLLFDELNANPVSKARLLAGADITLAPILTAQRIVAASGEGKIAFLELR